MASKKGNIKKKVLVLCSGGIDSTALMFFYKKLGFHVTAFFVNYKQQSKKYELQAVKSICNQYKFTLKSIEIKGKFTFGEGDIIGRNLFLISSALLFSNLKSGIIAIGVHAGTDYIDCSASFINKCNETFTLYSDGKIILAAPFMDWSKSNIIQYCHVENIPLSLTYSCERGTLPACGMCGTCKEINKIYARKDK